MKTKLIPGIVCALIVSGVMLIGSPQPQVLEGGRGYLGVVIRDINGEDVKALSLEAESGIYIERVEKGSPAEEAGLQKEDVVLEIAGLPVISVRQFRRLVGDIPPGRVVELALVRSGSRQQVSVKLGSRGKMQAWAIEVPEAKEYRAIPRFHFEGKPMPFGEGGYSLLYRGRPRLGIEGSALTDQMADYLGVSGGSGVLIMRVLEDTPAEQAGLKAGDVITEVDGHAVDSPSELMEQLDSGEHDLSLVRNKARLSVNVKLSGPETRSSETLEM